MTAQAQPSSAKTSTAKAEQARALFAQGQEAYDGGRLKEARGKLERAYRLAPLPELLFNLGRVCERLGESDAALAHYRAYLKSDLAPAERAQIEKRIDALLAFQMRQQEQLLQAPTASALKGEARRFFERGRKFFHKKEFAAALAAFVAAKRYSPAPELDYNLALISERLSLLSDAIDYYNAYLGAAPNAADAERVRARIRMLTEDGATDRSPPPAAR